MPTPENPNSTQLRCESCGTHLDSSEDLKAHATSSAAAEVIGSRRTGTKKARLEAGFGSRLGQHTVSVRPLVPFAAMFQNWRNLTFLHWRFPATAIAQTIPAPLEVDNFDGSAWVAITPFWLSGLRPPLLPAVPWLSAFPETNCRTYVRGPDGEAGVWFWSLDAARALAVLGARVGYGLPYAWSRMQVTIVGRRIHNESRRRWPDRAAMTRIEVERGESMEAGELEDFLTARFRLYSFIGGG